MSANSDPKQDFGVAARFTMLAATFAVLLSMAALLAVALKLDNSGGTQSASAAASTEGAAASPESVKVTVKSDEEEGKKGTDGAWHDAFLPADFSVKAGAIVKVTVYNYDDMPHTFTSTGLGTNVEIAPGSEDKPSKTTFTFKAPDKAGSYEWYCALPCDPYSMVHFGFMKGHVTVA